MAGKAFSEYARTVQVAVLMGVGLLIGAGAFWFWVWPVIQDGSAASQELAQLRASNQSGRTLEAQRAQLQRKIEEAEARLAAIKTMVPDDPDDDGLVTLLREAENASGVHIRSLASQPAVTAQEYVELPYKMHVDGTYFALLTFFDRLASATRIVNVNSLGLVVPIANGRGAFRLDPSETVATDFVLSAYCNHAPAGAVPAAKKP